MNNKRDYCRLCAGYQPKIKLVELQNNEKKCHDIVNKLSRFNIQVNLSDNVLSKVVCITCVTSLERAYNFVAAVEQGQLAINNLISVRQIKKESQQENSDDENCIYEEDDPVTKTYIDIKDEFKNVNSCNSISSESENSKHNHEDVSDSDSYVYSENIHKKSKSTNDNPCKSVSLKTEHVEGSSKKVVFNKDNWDHTNYTKDNVNVKVESKTSNLKSGTAKTSNESLSDDDNFIYVVVTNEKDGATKVESKKVNSAFKSRPSNSKDSEKSIERKTYCSHWDSLPASQMGLSFDDYNWLCSYCETEFPSFNELRSHSMQYHNACNPYRCTDCKIRKLRLNSFLVHLRRHRQYLKFSCYQCPAKFNTTIDATQHRRQFHMKTDFICFGCNENFTSQAEWLKHTRTFYKNTRATSILALQDDSLTCYMCNAAYKNRKQLNCHLLTHSNNICEICGKCYYQKSSLASHLISHSDVRPFQCEICTSSFKTPRRLKLHMTTHDGNKPFKCDTCDKRFRLKKHLNNHMMTHTDNLPHVCKYCDKRFRTKGLLNQHIRQHTGVKPYNCDICNRNFTNWANYNKHMKRKHDMNMAKTKRTPAGSFPIDPNTGEVICPSEEKITQWRQKNMELKNAGSKRTTKNKKSTSNT